MTKVAFLIDGGKIVYAINSLEQLAKHLEKMKLHISP